MDQFVHDGTDADTAVSRPVTARSRITGTSRSVVRDEALAGELIRPVDWAAVIASVVVGMAVTAMLTILGVSSGLIAGSEGTTGDEAAGILGAVGAWTVVAAVIGAFVGSVVGGRLARWLDRGSLAYHAITSWGLATILSILLATLVSIGFATTATSAATATVAAEQTSETPAENAAATGAQGGTAAETTNGADANGDGTNGRATNGDEAADNTGDALGGAGLALTLGMLLTLGATAAGWWIGSRKRLTDFEREPMHQRPAAV